MLSCVSALKTEFSQVVILSLEQITQLAFVKVVPGAAMLIPIILGDPREL